jgi:hypothetical protein
MSWVTNAILHYTQWYGPDFLEQVNTFFEGRGKGFVSVHDEQLPPHWYGGSKHLECELAIGAFNHLDVEGLVRHLCSLIGPHIGKDYQLDYEYEELQLIVLEQDQEPRRFRLINIMDELAKYAPKSEDGPLPD